MKGHCGVVLYFIPFEKLHFKRVKGTRENETLMTSLTTWQAGIEDHNGSKVSCSCSFYNYCFYNYTYALECSLDQSKQAASVVEL